VQNPMQKSSCSNPKLQQVIALRPKFRGNCSGNREK
jgi:hypothetical protein